MLDGAPLGFKLPTDRDRPAARNFAGGRIEAALAQPALQAACDLAQRHDVSLATVLFSAFVCLCHRYTAEADIVIGIPVAGRESAMLSDHVGLLARLTPVRVIIPEGASSDELIQLSNVALREAQAHQPFAIDLAMRDYAKLGTVGAPLKLLFNAYQVADEAEQPIAALAAGVAGPELDLGGLVLCPQAQPPGRIHHDLVLNLFRQGSSFRIALHYAAELFDDDRIRRLLLHYQELLRGLAEQPTAKLGKLPLLDAAERHHILTTLAGPDQRGPPDNTLHRLFEGQVERTPAALALVAGDLSMTYSELDGAAGQLAYRLRTIEGVKIGDVIGIHLKRDARLVIAMLAVLKAGAAYVPLDPGYPLERLNGMVADAGIRKIIGDGHDGPFAAAHIPMSQLGFGASDGPSLAPLNVPAGATAYILFTSGSTGRPKGVMIGHRSAAAMVRWAEEQFGHDLERVFASTSVSFDLSIFEIFGPLCSGGTVILASSLLALPDMFRAQRPSLISGVPSVMASVLEQVETLPDLRCVALAGERLSPELADRVLAACPRAKLFDLYGPTEVTTYATGAARTSGAEETVGRPLPFTRVYILDSTMHPVPQGNAGEVWLGGDRLAVGYAGQPGWTADRFLPDPFTSHAGSRMYRTGDRGCLNANGELRYLGRLDRQLKIRGFRVEPDEVEVLLCHHPSVVQAAVVATASPDQTLRLVAWLVLRDDAQLADVKTHLAKYCPAYLIPNTFVAVEQLPKTPTGKIDRAALTTRAPPQPSAEESSANLAPDVLEIAACMAAALDLDRVGADENFFHLGGHSLAAVRLCTLLGKARGHQIPVIAPFDHPTPRRLAGYLDDASLAGPRETSAVQPGPPASSRSSLSFLQRQIWYVYRTDETVPTYNMALLLRFDRPVTVDDLRTALQETVLRHAALRCRLADERGEPHQLIVANPDVRIPEINLSSHELVEAAARFARTEFDLRCELPVRAIAFLTPDGPPVLGLAVHHIMIDGASLKLVVDDFLTRLAARVAGAQSGERQVPSLEDTAPLLFPADPGEEILAEDRAFWRARLRGLEPSRLAPDRSGQPGSASGRTHRFRIPRELAVRLATLAADEEATAFMGLLAAFAALIGRITGREEAVLAVPVALRQEPALERAVGMFVQPVVVRMDLSANPSFRALVRRVRADVLDAIAHSRLPYEQVIEAAGVSRDGTADPLYSILFAVQNGPARHLQVAGLSVSSEPLDSGTARSELTVLVDITGDGIDCAFEYRSGVLDAATIESIGSGWITLLESAVAQPEASIGLLPVVSAIDRDKQLNKWNSRSASRSDVKLLHQLVLQQVNATPDAVALTDRFESWTYRRLAQRAATYAATLRDNGVGPGHVIGLCLGRQPDTIAAMLGIMMAGAAWLPLDPAYPTLRLTALAETAAVSLVIAEPDWRPSLFADKRMDPPAERIDEFVEMAICSERSLAYSMSTSGSTGRPKAVGIEHGSAVDLINWAATTFEPGERAVIPWCTSIAFDLTIFELFLPLSTGGEVIIVDDVLSLNDHPARQRLTMINTIPSGINASLRLGPVPSGVKTICLAGEPLSPELVELVRQQSAAERVVDLYGPTEATTYATFTERRRNEPPNVGRPLGGIAAYVLDQRLGLLPVGVVGELYIGGSGLARGYLGAPAATADRFIPNPFSTRGERLYRTGDRARLLADGRIQLLGRVDHQVKVRGFRIELGEVESVLTRHPDVVDAAAVVQAGDAGGKKLVAFASCQGKRPDPVALIDWVARHLPHFAVPAACVVLDELPRLPNGKLDRAALPRITPPSHQAGPEDDGSLGGIIIALWTDLLGVAPLRNSSFFEAGGNSLHGVSLIARLGAICGAKLSLRDFLANPTLDGIEAAARRARHWQGVPMLPAPHSGDPADEGALSFAQQQIWLFTRLAHDSPVYNVGYVMRLQESPDRVRLQSALRELVRRHPALRTGFVQGPDQPRQIVHKETSLTLQYIPLDKAATQRDAVDQIRIMLRQPFDVAEPPLLRTMLVTFGNGAALLGISAHHIIVDAWSLDVLLGELGLLYQGTPVHPPSGVGPIEFAAWEQSWLGTPNEAVALRRWQNRLAGLQPTIQLERTAARSDFAGTTVERVLPPEVRDRLRHVAMGADATLLHAALAAFALLLRSLSGKDELAIGLPVTMRRDPKWASVIGFFANTVPMRLDLAFATDVRTLLQHVRDAVLDAHDWGWLPLPRIVDAWRVPRDPLKPELFNAIFVMHDKARARDICPPLSGSYVPVDLGVARCDLMLSVLDQSEGLVLHLETSLVERANVLLDGLTSIVEQLIEGRIANGPAGVAPSWPAPTMDALSRTIAAHPAIADWHLTERDGGRATAYLRLRPGETLDKSLAARPRCRASSGLLPAAKSRWFSGQRSSRSQRPTGHLAAPTNARPQARSADQPSASRHSHPGRTGLRISTGLSRQPARRAEARRSAMAGSRHPFR